MQSFLLRVAVAELWHIEVAKFGEMLHLSWHSTVEVEASVELKVTC